MTILFVRTIGNSLILAGVFWFCYSFYPVFKADFFYQFDQARGVERKVSVEEVPPNPPRISFGELLKKPKPLKITPVSRDFGIVIPKINANSVVIPNVDPANRKEYSQKLLLGVAHAKGTVFPGQVGNCYLFSHSVGHPWEVPRYNAQFYLLPKLKKGDLVHLFYQNKQFDYRVVQTTVAKAEDTSWLNAIYHQPTLTLQTCYPPGTTWQRFVVIAKLIS